MSNDYLQETENQIIGGILRFGLKDEYCIYALNNLSESDFLIDVNKIIFKHLKNTYNLNAEIDKVKLLKDANLSNEQFYELFDSCYTVSNFKSYVEILKKRSEDNRIIDGITSIQRAENKYEALEQLYISEKELKESQSISLKQQETKKYLDFLEYISNPIKPGERIPTGFPTIDDKLSGGFQRKSISTIGAYPSTGKTTLALNIARNQIKHKNRTLFFSSEMSFNQIMERLSADVLSLPYSTINKKQLTDKEKCKVGMLLDNLSVSDTFYIFDDIIFIEDIAREIAKFKPVFVIIDFIQRVKTYHKTNTAKERLDYISSEIKSLAKLYDCHIMTLSQLARKGEGHMPTMSDLKESGALEQDNDYIILLYRPNVGDKKQAESDAQIIIDKNKYGETGIKNMYFAGGYQRFTERG